MDEVCKEASNRGYEDGRNMRSKNPTKYGYKSPYHTGSYNRGYEMGRKDYERLEKEESERSKKGNG